MGCNCKSGQNNKEQNVKLSELSFKEKIKLFLYYSLKVFGFLVGVLLLPIINIAIIWFMFNTIVLTKEVNIKEFVMKIMGNTLKDDDDDDDDDDFEDLTEDDVIMLDVEDITHQTNKNN